jgi:general secretion pathway protein G
MTRNMKRGFTLVEILIVVIILGILAAIVIPQFTNASNDARESNLRSQLQTLRSQIELYKLQHLDAPPTSAATFWTQLTTKTDNLGNASAAADAVGPYMQQAALNPLNEDSAVADAAAAGVGWVYTAATGQIRATDAAGTGLFVE